MTGEIFEVGQLIELTGTFTQVSSGSNIDPDTVGFTIKAPDGTITTYTYGTNPQIARKATGIYYVDWSLDQSGAYWYRFFSTGNGQAANEAYIVSRISRVTA